LNILLQSRTTLFSVPGGDTIQLVNTARALRDLGCRVDISIELEPNLSGFDLVHVFNLTRPQEVYLQVANAKHQGKPVALSTIYVDYSEYDRRGRRGVSRVVMKILAQKHIEYLKVLARAVINCESNKGTWVLLRRGYRTLQREIIAMSDVFLPNSASEMLRVTADFPECINKRQVVVPNAVDTSLFDTERTIGDQRFEAYRGCVLSVARIEGLKNQLNLVRAMRGLPWKLVLVGKPAPNHINYYEQLVREAGPNVHIIGPVDHEDLPGLYQIAKVHCLVSWMETTGLSSLEAGAMGCNIVVTEKGDTRDYFDDFAYYCEPDSVSSIRNAIISAYENPVDPALRTLILRNYTWEKTAGKTMEGYKNVLEQVR